MQTPSDVASPTATTATTVMVLPLSVTIDKAASTPDAAEINYYAANNILNRQSNSSRSSSGSIVIREQQSSSIQSSPVQPYTPDMPSPTNSIQFHPAEFAHYDSSLLVNSNPAERGSSSPLPPALSLTRTASLPAKGRLQIQGAAPRKISFDTPRWFNTQQPVGNSTLSRSATPPATTLSHSPSIKRRQFTSPFNKKNRDTMFQDPLRQARYETEEVQQALKSEDAEKAIEAFTRAASSPTPGSSPPQLPPIERTSLTMFDQLLSESQRRHETPPSTPELTDKSRSSGSSGTTALRTFNSASSRARTPSAAFELLKEVLDQLPDPETEYPAEHGSYGAPARISSRDRSLSTPAHFSPHSSLNRPDKSENAHNEGTNDEPFCPSSCDLNESLQMNANRRTRFFSAVSLRKSTDDGQNRPPPRKMSILRIFGLGDKNSSASRSATPTPDPVAKATLGRHRWFSTTHLPLTPSPSPIPGAGNDDKKPKAGLFQSLLHWRVGSTTPTPAPQLSGKELEHTGRDPWLENEDRNSSRLSYAEDDEDDEDDDYDDDDDDDEYSGGEAEDSSSTIYSPHKQSNKAGIERDDGQFDGEYVKPKAVYPNLIANKSRSLSSLIEQRMPSVNTSSNPSRSTASSRVTSVESSYGREIANSISQQLELTPSRRTSTLSLSTGSVEWTIPRRHTIDRSEHSEHRLSSADTEKSVPSLRRHKTEYQKHESIDSEQLRVRYAAIRRLSESTLSSGSNPTLQRSTMSSRTSGKLRNHTVDWQPRDQDLILDSDSPAESSPTNSIFSRFRKKHRTHEGAVPAGSFSAKHIPLGKDVREMTPAYLDQDTATVREELIFSSKTRETPTPSFSDHTVLRGTPIPDAVGLGLPLSPTTAQLVPVAPPTTNATLFPVQIPVASFSSATMTTSYNNMVVGQTLPHEYSQGIVNPSFMGMVPSGSMMLAPSPLQNQIIAGSAQNITTTTSHIQTAHMVHQTIHIHCSHAGTLLPGATSAATCTCYHEQAASPQPKASNQNGLRKRLFSNPSKHNVSAVDDVTSAIEDSQSGSFAEILRTVVERTQKNDPSLAYSLPVLQEADWNSLTVELKDAIQRQANGRLNERILKMSISGSQSGPPALPNAPAPIMATPVTGSYMLVQAMPTPDIVYFAAESESQPQFFPPHGN
ncbi:hypothetical protein BJ742DRAFT_105405 [Cladochytrium replicatum]|nr:hypothetical protein BJ742DRAFT_105405 [Cladochytrium replicatum]